MRLMALTLEIVSIGHRLVQEHCQQQCCSDVIAVAESHGFQLLDVCALLLRCSWQVSPSLTGIPSVGIKMMLGQHRSVISHFCMA
jgi:hypothetical protein